jgi:predicted aldo/keto reductase-like oxidoreductase
MKYRTLGRTGLKVSEISVGTEWLEKKSPELITTVLRKAIENGVNYFDIIFNSEEYLKKISKAIEGQRDKIILTHHLGSSVTKEGKYKKNRSIKSCTKHFEQYLEIMNTDYVDVMFITFVLNEKQYNDIITKENGSLNLALKYKKEGKVKFLGISTHNLQVVKKAALNGNFDVIMFQINIANNAMPNRNEVLALCAKENIGLVAMKPFAGGVLFRKNKKVGLGGYRTGGLKLEKKIPDIVTPVRCIHYNLNQIGVSTIVPGCASVEELEEDLSYYSATDEEKDYSMLLKEFDEYKTGECVYCNHCQPCPEDIDIGRVFKLYDIANYELTAELKTKYNDFDALASDCSECGVCEERCPFEVKVIDKMKEVVELLE